MIIRKRYNVEQLAEQLQTEIENSKKYNRVVKLDILTASDILDVLNETNKREQKHQTLESACNFMEMEDGTQTNEMELHNKKDANGNTLRGMDYLLKRMLKPVCFGCHIDVIRKCNLCICEKECMIETEARDCFGAYDGDIECECCDSKEACENVKNYNIDDEEDVL